MQLRYHEDKNTKKLPHTLQFWENRFSIMPNEWDKYFSLPRKIYIDTFTQTLQYKLTHRIIFTNERLYKIKLKNNPSCKKCGEVETLIHMFVGCGYIRDFWNKWVDWWNNCNLGYMCVPLTERDIILGNIEDGHIIKCLNYTLLLAKRFIYENREQEKCLSFINYLQKLKFELVLVEYASIMKNKNEHFNIIFGELYENL